MVSSNLVMSDRRVSAAKRLETVDLYPMTEMVGQIRTGR